MSEQEQFEQKIVSLLEGACTPDTQVVKQATKQLKKDLKRPATMIVLMKLVANHPETAIRWSAALYFRQKIVNHWDKLQPAQSQFQQTLLETISKEPHPSTRKALAEAIAVIARIALPAGQWDQLLPTLIGFSQDQNVANRQAAFKIFQSLTEGLGDDLAAQYDQLHPILSNGMQDPDSEVQLFAINAIASIMPHLEEQFAPLIRNALPIIFQLVEKFMNEGRETETCDALEIFIYLVETPLPILEGDLFEQLIMFMLKIGTSPLPRSIRQSAMVVVEFAGMCHPKRIVRSGVLDAVFDALFVMSAEEPQGDEAYDDDEEEATDASSSYKYSCQLIDALCGELASQVTAPIVMNKINEYFNGSPRQRRTALGALAVICESLGEQLLEVVDQLVPSVLDSCQHEVDFVRLSAYVCMAHFAEHLAPAMQKHSRPVTLVLLGGAREQSMRVRGACLYAIRSLCDNLYEEVAAETAQLIAPPLIEMLRDPQSDYEFKEMVMSALTACANVTHEHFLPYLAPVMESIAEGLSLTDDADPAQMGFRAQVSEASSVVAMAVGAEAFQPYFDGCVSQILSGMELNAPELRCCSYLFFSNLSQLLGEEFAPLLEPVMPFLLTALRAPTSAFEAELEHSDSEDDEDELAGDADDFAGSARSGVLVEKTQAAKSVGVIGLHAGAAFAPYLQPSIVALAQCLGHAYVDLRGSALLAMGQLTVLMHRRTSNGKKWERGSAAQNPISDETTQLVKVVMPMAIGGLIGDPHPEGAQNAANVARDILTEVGPAALEPFAASLGDAVLVVSRGKGSCQVALDAFDMSNDVAESGRDEDLLDAAWDLLVTAAKTSTPDFTVALLKAFVPELLKFTGDTYPPIFGALAIGTLGELVGACETDVSFCSGDVLQGCLRIIGRAEETSQVNASFCIGCLYSHGGEPVHSKTIDILRAMHPIFEQPLSERVADNACGALGRMLTSSVGAHVPLEVLPLFMKNLPIKDDDAEKVSAYSGLLALAERNASVFGNHVEDLTRIVASELVSDECPKEQLSGLVQLLKMMASDNNAQQIISNTASQLNDNERQMLQQALN